MDTTKKERTIIHLIKDDKHYYFGSMICIYDYFSASELGITYNSLKNYHLSESHPYSNEKCTIYRGTLKTKKKK